MNYEELNLEDLEDEIQLKNYRYSFNNQRVSKKINILPNFGCGVTD
jgi:hypothetical protein